MTAQRFIVSSEQLSADLDPGADADVVILGLKEGLYYRLEGVGARIWSLLSEPRLPEEIVATLLDEYEVDREQCEGDVRRLIDELLERGLVIAAES